MKRFRVRWKGMFLGITIVAFIACQAQNVFAWGAATHAYVADRVSEKNGIFRANEIYGSNAPDIFNNLFMNPDYVSYFGDETHYEPGKVWNEAKSKPAKALARGFYGHNEFAGGDSTAHNGGYVIQKAAVLAQILQAVPQFTALGIDEGAVLDVAHFLVEYGIDLLVVQQLDPQIGQKIMESAIRRNPQLPTLLVRAYAKGFSESTGTGYHAVSRFIKQAEKEFRESQVYYGYALTQDLSVAAGLISEQIAEVAGVYLAASENPLPEGIDITPLIAFALDQSMALCSDDFADAIENTVETVEGHLATQGIDY
ncbi:MAG: hypothetical protein GTN70_10430 [Deltaproteobacteria bacterium]|nr:hypothetical protein [Deltaproteobacteria bacterium]NIS78106.1 hypothetical protein [Deltaproteobacteria bacterium]